MAFVNWNPPLVEFLLVSPLSLANLLLIYTINVCLDPGACYGLGTLTTRQQLSAQACCIHPDLSTEVLVPFPLTLGYLSFQPVVPQLQLSAPS